MQEQKSDQSKQEETSLGVALEKSAEADAVAGLEAWPCNHPSIGHNDGPCCAVCELSAQRDVLRHELENIYMLARKKRAVRHSYPEGFPEVPRKQIGPASNDPDWDHVIRFCEQAGLKPTILRTMGEKPDTASSEASALHSEGTA